MVPPIEEGRRDSTGCEEGSKDQRINRGRLFEVLAGSAIYAYRCLADEYREAASSVCGILARRLHAKGFRDVARNADCTYTARLQITIRAQNATSDRDRPPPCPIRAGNGSPDETRRIGRFAFSVTIYQRRI